MEEFGPISYIPPIRLPERVAPAMLPASKPVDAPLFRRQHNTALAGEISRRWVTDFKYTAAEGLLIGFRIAGFLGIIRGFTEDEDQRNRRLIWALDAVGKLNKEEATSDEKLRELIGERYRRSLRQNKYN